MFSYCWCMSGYKRGDKCQGGVFVKAGYMYNERFGFSSHLNQDLDTIDVLKNAVECYVMLYSIYSKSLMFFISSYCCVDH